MAAEMKVERGIHAQANFISKITHHYLQPLIELGYERPLEEADMKAWPLDSQDHVVGGGHLDTFEAALIDAETGKVDAAAAILSTLGWRYALVGTWKFLYLVSVLGQPALLYRCAASPLHESRFDHCFDHR